MFRAVQALLDHLRRITDALEVANQINDETLAYIRERDARDAQRNDEWFAFHRINRQTDDMRAIARMEEESTRYKERREEEREVRAMIAENMLAIFKRNPRRYLEAIGMPTAPIMQESVPDKEQSANAE